MRRRRPDAAATRRGPPTLDGDPCRDGVRAGGAGLGGLRPLRAARRRRRRAHRQGRDQTAGAARRASLRDRARPEDGCRRGRDAVVLPAPVEADHGATGALPPDYRALVERRLEFTAAAPYLHLIERPECKRRWQTEPWEKQESEALENWLLDRLEDRRLWFIGDGFPRLRTVAQLADEVRTDPDFVAELLPWVRQGHDEPDPTFGPRPADAYQGALDG